MHDTAEGTSELQPRGAVPDPMGVEMRAPETTIGGAASPVPRRSEPPVHPPNRNGYASVVGRIFDLIAKTPVDLTRRARTALLTRSDEELLRSADGQQVGDAGLSVALHGSKDEWRAFVRENFGRKYRLLVIFEASETDVL